ncbi:hypothetical protein ACUOFC_66545, partial [Escherichia sp. TWPC-MK]
GCAQTPYPVRDLVRLFAGCGVNALSGLRFGASVGRISAAHPALIHAGLNGRGLCALFVAVGVDTTLLARAAEALAA